MPHSSDLPIVNAPAETSGPRARTTLSVRAGSVVRATGADTDRNRQASLDRTTAGAPASQNGPVPLKRLTAGRKELKIAHDGATYLLRVTKSNKLILTKAEPTPAAISTS